ncbi:ERF family protein [Weissella diestrammenae]|uniref:ERF family protein n=1 Tax=Weissella diestrammenae TaxID=1162633 RepID=UPI0030B81822
MMNIYEKLLAIQFDLRAPKNQKNDFGKFSYRSVEDILEAVKPLLKEQEVTLTLGDG